MRPMYGIFKLLKQFVKLQIEKNKKAIDVPAMSHAIDGVTLYCLFNSNFRDQSTEGSNGCV